MTPEEIRHIRDSYGLSREQFARALGVSSQSVLNWERGTHRPSGVQDILLHGLGSKLYDPEEMERMRQALMQAQYMPPDFAAQEATRPRNAELKKVLPEIGLGVLLIELLKEGTTMLKSILTGQKHEIKNLSTLFSGPGNNFAPFQNLPLVPGEGWAIVVYNPTADTVEYVGALYGRQDGLKARVEQLFEPSDSGNTYRGKWQFANPGGNFEAHARSLHVYCYKIATGGGIRSQVDSACKFLHDNLTPTYPNQKYV